MNQFYWKWTVKSSTLHCGILYHMQCADIHYTFGDQGISRIQTIHTLVYIPYTAEVVECYSKQPKSPRTKTNCTFFFLTADRDYGRSGLMTWLSVTASNLAFFFSWFRLNACEGCFSPSERFTSDRSSCTKASKPSSSLSSTCAMLTYNSKTVD